MAPLSSDSANGQQQTVTEDASQTKQEQADGGGGLPAAVALSQLTATLREAKRGSPFIGEGKSTSRVEAKVVTRAELLKAAARFIDRSSTISRERSKLKAITNKKNRYTHSPGCNARRAGGVTKDDDDSDVQSFGTALRRVMMDVYVSNIRRKVLVTECLPK